MPRTRLSVEEKILDYFQTAPLDAANVTLKFAMKTMRDRTPVPEKPAKKPTRRKAAPVAGEPAPQQEQSQPAPARPTRPSNPGLLDQTQTTSAADGPKFKA